MQASVLNFKMMLRYSFMGSTSDLCLLTNKKVFNWSQDHTAMEYLLAKTQKLWMAGCTVDDELVACIWEGLRDAP